MSWMLDFPFKPGTITVTNYLDPVEIVNIVSGNYDITNIDDDEYEIVEMED